ncbi:uncharacterized protein [Musca autumnalis]|uniref:uncharacterized protein n=1 Tax=Musca autumnalis TaxID=221902 RepID=UPI003CF4D780
METRSKSKERAETAANAFPTAAGTIVTGVVLNPNTAGSTAVPASSLAPPVASDVSLSSEAFNDSIQSPEFASQTARDIRIDCRKEKPGLTLGSVQDPELQYVIASVERAQEQLLRSVEDIRRLHSDWQRRLSMTPVQGTVAAHNKDSGPMPNSQPTAQQSEPGNGRPLPPATGPPPRVNSRTQDQHANQAAGTGNWQPSPNFSYPSVSSPGPRFNLKKWGIRFDGSNKTVDAEDFIFRVESLRHDYAYPFEELVKDFPQLLDGQALDWYWQQRRIAPFQSWSDLRSAFLSQFRRFESEFQIQKRIMDRRQQPQESFEDFFNAVLKLRNQQRVPYSENDLVEIMKGNLKSSLAALIFPIRIHGLNHFQQEVKRAENMLSNQRQTFQQRSYPMQRVHELYYEEPYMEENREEVEMEVDAIRDTTKYTCWNCKKPGHSYIECSIPISRVFCFRCGREGVLAPKCPKCQGNGSRSVPRTAEARSTQTESPQQ